MINRKISAVIFVFASVIAFAQDATKVPLLSGPEMTNKKGSEYNFDIKSKAAVAVDIVNTIIQL